MFIESIQNKIKFYKEIVPGNNFNPNIPIDFEILENFEKNYKILIPTDYREFILKIGNGEFELNNDYFFELTATTAGDITKPFNPNNENGNFDGLLELVELNHAGGIIYLVTNGDEYGNIWFADNHSNLPIKPYLNKNNEIMNFTALINYYFDCEMEYYLKARENAKRTAIELQKNQITENKKSEKKSIISNFMRMFRI